MNLFLCPEDVHFNVLLDGLAFCIQKVAGLNPLAGREKLSLLQGASDHVRWCQATNMPYLKESYVSVAILVQMV